MSTDRQTTRLVRSWLEEGATALPDRVLDAVLDQVPATPQRRPWWPSRRSTHVNTSSKLLAAAAAVLVVGVVGYQLIPRNSGPGGTTPPASPTATPEPTEVPRLPAGPIDAGTYRMGNGPTFLVTVPAGWVNHGGTSIRKHLDEPNEVAVDTYPGQVRVFADACQSTDTSRAVGPTAEDLVAALVAQENSETSDPIDVTFAGLPGTRLELSVPVGLDLSRCSIGTLQIWVAATTNYLAGIGTDRPATVYVADTPEGRLLVVPNPANGTPADIAEVEGIVASIEYLSSGATASP